MPNRAGTPKRHRCPPTTVRRASWYLANVPPSDPDEELAALRRQTETLKQQLEQLQRRIDELEKAKRG